jgi:hypothetical protein
MLPPLCDPVTVLPNLIISISLYQKFIQKYKWTECANMYHHAKFKVEKNLCKKKQEEKLALE